MSLGIKKSEAIAKVKNLFQNKEYDFVLMFNSRNIRRKQIPDTLLAYKYFIDTLPIEKAKKCCFLLHTQVADENGTNLGAVKDLLIDDEKAIHPRGDCPMSSGRRGSGWLLGRILERDHPSRRTDIYLHLQVLLVLELDLVCY